MLKVCAKFKTTLASGIDENASEAVLVSNVTSDADGSVLPDGNYGFVIDEGGAYEEFVIASVSGVNLTFFSRGIAYYDGNTIKTGNKKPHRKGASIKITDHPVLARIIRVLNGDAALENILLLPESRTISDPRHVVDKEYADSIATAGITSLQVTENSGVTINVGAGNYVLNGALTVYAGASNVQLTDEETNYVQMKDGALDINLVGFDDDAMPLATVVCTSGYIASLVDARAILAWTDIKASYGIARDSNGIFIDLSETPNLEFSEGKLQLKSELTGVLIFDSIPVLPESDPTEDNEATRKKYVDDLVASSFIGAVVSDITLRASADTEQSSNDSLGNFTIKKQFEVMVAGTVRIKFQAKKVTNGSAKVYLNDVAKSGNFTLTETYADYYYDVVVRPGDLVQLALSSGDYDDYAYCRNVRLYYDFGIVTLADLNPRVITN